MGDEKDLHDSLGPWIELMICIATVMIISLIILELIDEGKIQ